MYFLVHHPYILLHFILFVKVVSSLISALVLYCLSLHQMTPLHVAAKKGECRKIMKYLIDKGVDINVKDHSGVSEIIVLVQQRVQNPFHLVCCFNFFSF